MKMTKELMQQRKDAAAFVFVGGSKGTAAKTWSIPSDEGIKRSYFQPECKPSEGNLPDKAAWLGRRVLHKSESAAQSFKKTAKFEQSFY